MDSSDAIALERLYQLSIIAGVFPIMSKALQDHIEVCVVFARSNKAIILPVLTQLPDPIADTDIQPRKRLDHDRVNPHSQALCGQSCPKAVYSAESCRGYSVSR